MPKYMILNGTYVNYHTPAYVAKKNPDCVQEGLLKKEGSTVIDALLCRGYEVRGVQEDQIFGRYTKKHDLDLKQLKQKEAASKASYAVISYKRPRTK